MNKTITMALMSDETVKLHIVGLEVQGTGISVSHTIPSPAYRERNGNQIPNKFAPGQTIHMNEIQKFAMDQKMALLVDGKFVSFYIPKDSETIKTRTHKFPKQEGEKDKGE